MQLWDFKQHGAKILFGALDREPHSVANFRVTLNLDSHAAWGDDKSVGLGLQYKF